MRDNQWRVGHISWSPDYKSEKPIPQVSPTPPPKPPSKKPKSPAKPDDNRNPKK